MKRKIILIGCILLVVVFGIYQNVANKLDVTDVNSYSKNISMMVYDEDESGYIEATSIPVGSYKLNDNLSYCEAGGSFSSYDSAAGTIKINTVGQDECYLYFDIYDPTLAETIIALTEEKDESETWQVVEENGYRYEGTSAVNNYLCLNSTCATSYRIIGVFETPYDADSDGTIEDGETDYLVKAVRTTQQTTTKAWNTTSSNNWTTATLQTSLNATSGTDEVNVYANMSDAVKSKIAKARWYLGNVTYNTTSAIMYSAERSDTVYSGNSEYYDNYIGLIYPSDYGYAPLASSCRSYTVDNYHNYVECDEQNWLFSGSNYWTVSPSSYSSSVAMSVFSSGYVRFSGVSLAYGVRESFYLVPSTRATGSGASDDPYVIIYDSSESTLNINTFTVSSAKSYNSNSTNLTVTVPLDIASSVSNICITTTNDSSTCTWEAKSSWTQTSSSIFTKTYTLSADEGSGSTVTLYAFVSDSAGNVSPSKTASYTLYEECTETTTTSTSGTCSVSCGGGTKTVTDTVKDKYLGTTCSTNSYTATCNTQSCSSSNTCTDWTAWTACNSSCPTGATYYRTCTTTGVTTKEYRYD